MVYKGLDCIEAGRVPLIDFSFKAVQGCYIRGWIVSKQVRVPHIDYVYVEAISKSNALMKFNRNYKRLKGSYKKLCDKKSILLA